MMAVEKSRNLSHVEAVELRDLMQPMLTKVDNDLWVYDAGWNDERLAACYAENGGRKVSISQVASVRAMFYGPLRVTAAVTLASLDALTREQGVKIAALTAALQSLANDQAKEEEARKDLARAVRSLEGVVRVEGSLFAGQRNNLAGTTRGNDRAAGRHVDDP
jgi:hypothetical protein